MRDAVRGERSALPRRPAVPVGDPVQATPAVGCRHSTAAVPTMRAMMKGQRGRRARQPAAPPSRLTEIRGSHRAGDPTQTTEAVPGSALVAAPSGGTR